MRTVEKRGRMETHGAKNQLSEEQLQLLVRQATMHIKNELGAVQVHPQIVLDLVKAYRTVNCKSNLTKTEITL